MLFRTHTIRPQMIDRVLGLGLDIISRLPTSAPRNLHIRANKPCSSETNTGARISCSCSVRRADPWFQSQQDVGRNQSRESRAATSVASKTAVRWRQGTAKQEHLTRDGVQTSKTNKKAIRVSAACSVTSSFCVNSCS